jgi:hypothetical protein
MKEREDRLEERLRQLGTDDPVCSSPDCNERNPFALSGVHPDILCHECRAIARGGGWTEEDHFAGRHNDHAKAAIPANDHRIRSERQAREWPRGTLRNPDQSPLLWSAAMQRGVRDYLELVLDRYSASVPEFHEALDAWLRGRVGERWFEEFKGDTGWEKP